MDGIIMRQTHLHELYILVTDACSVPKLNNER